MDSRWMAESTGSKAFVERRGYQSVSRDWILIAMPGWLCKPKELADDVGMNSERDYLIDGWVPEGLQRDNSRNESIVGWP
jgi:hypothetical protein